MEYQQQAAPKKNTFPQNQMIFPAFQMPENGTSFYTINKQEKQTKPKNRVKL